MIKTNTVCPVHFIRGMATMCVKDGCEWWNDKCKMCGWVMLAQNAEKGGDTE